MRAATALLSLLHDAGTVPAAIASSAGASSPSSTLPPALRANHRIWRADEVAGADVPGLSTGHPALDAELPGGGWPAGQLTELLLEHAGVGELSLLAPALARCAREQRACVWVLPVAGGSNTSSRPSGGKTGVNAADALPYAPALAAAGLDMTQHIFVNPATPREALWALEQSLRAAHLGAVIGWLPESVAGTRSSDGDFRALRRLHLLASRHHTLAFMLRPARAASAPSPAALRLQLAAADERQPGRLQVTLLKRRGRPLLAPITLQVHPVRWNAAQIDAPSLPAAAAAATIAVPTAARATAMAPALPARRWSMQAIFSH